MTSTLIRKHVLALALLLACGEAAGCMPHGSDYEEVVIVTIQSPEDLDGLVGVGLIEGPLVIECPSCTSLKPLIALQSVGSLTIRGCAGLTTLDGLNNLELIQSGLVIQDNATLTSLEVLRSLNLPGSSSSLTISNNPMLQSLEGLSGRTSVLRLSIEDNAALSSLDALRTIAKVDGTLSIHRNDSLAYLDGLGGIEHVRGSVWISANAALLNLDELGNVASVGGHLRIEGNEMLSNLDGLHGVTSVGQVLHVDEFHPSLPACAAVKLRDSIGIDNIGAQGFGVSFPTDCACTDGAWESSTTNCP